MASWRPGGGRAPGLNGSMRSESSMGFTSFPDIQGHGSLRGSPHVAMLRAATVMKERGRKARSQHQASHTDKTVRSNALSKSRTTLCITPMIDPVPLERREELEESQKFGRRLNYGRYIGVHRQEINQLVIARRTESKHREVGSKNIVQPPPLIDWSYFDIASVEMLARIVPRRAKTRSNVEKRRKKGDDEYSEGEEEAPKIEQRFAWEDETLYQRAPTFIKIIKQGDKTYAFDRRDLSKFESESKLAVVKSPSERSLLDTPTSRAPSLPSLASHSHKGHEPHRDAKYLGTNVRLSNNQLPALDGALPAMLRAQVIQHVVILDLSFNAITHIAPGFAVDGNGNILMPALATLYLHANAIVSVKELYHLQPLNRTLKCLTVHGNPKIDSTKGSRETVLKMMPGLTSLNFTAVTPMELC